MAVNLDDNECFTNFVTWLDNNSSSIIIPQMLSKGEVATSLIEQHYSLQQNQSKKKLLEQVASKTNFDLMYPPSVMTCSLCFANCTNIYIGKCPKCGGKTIRKHLEKPMKEIKFSNMDPISVIPHEYLFVVGRHTKGKTLDTFHRFRAERFYYK
jgi:Zn-finger nucleic acid-binding protein